MKPAQGGGKTAKREDVNSEEEDGEDAYEEEESEAPAEVSEEDYDSDAPPKVTFIPLPKLRETNGIPYADATLHPNTLLFLRDLKAHNQRPWLKSHDEEFRRALKDWESYVTTLTDRLIDLDPTIPELPLRDVIFRIYRDTRFSKDPTPYKPHFSAAWSRTGRKGPYACYYVHVEPGGKCSVGGGLWSPEAGSVGRLRASIDERPHRWRRVLGEDGFSRMFFGKEAGKGGDEGSVKRFVERNQRGALKTKPKGFNADHRDIGLLKLKNYTISKKLPDSVLTAEDSQDQIAEIFGAMVGFVGFLNSVVMPDPGQDDDSEEDDSGHEDGSGNGSSAEESEEEADAGDDE